MKVTWRVFLGSPLTSSYAVSGETPHVPPASVSEHCILTVRKTARDGTSANAGDHTAKGSRAHFLVKRGSASLLYFMPIFALMLKPFCTLDSSRPSPVQWATTTSVRTLAHIVTSSLKSSIQINMQLGLPQEMTPRKREGAAYYFIQLELSTWSYSHGAKKVMSYMHVCLCVLEGGREKDTNRQLNQREPLVELNANSKGLQFFD